MTRHVLLYTDEDEMRVAEVPSLPGCGSDGRTKMEALERIKEAIQVYIEAFEGDGLPIPEEYRNVELAASGECR